eukprot:COSAG01_NODE_48643_length_379_cov_0.900000_1_plen_60_part_10
MLLAGAIDLGANGPNFRQNTKQKNTTTAPKISETSMPPSSNMLTDIGGGAGGGVLGLVGV